MKRLCRPRCSGISLLASPPKVTVLLMVIALAMTSRNTGLFAVHDDRPSTSGPAGHTSPADSSVRSTTPDAGAVETVDLGEGVQLQMVYVPGGSFLMGSPDSERDAICRRIEAGPKSEFTPDVLDAIKLEGPVHAVELDAFWMGRCELTVAQFRRFVLRTSYETEAEKRGESGGVSPSGGWSKMRGLSWRKPGFPQGDDHPVVHVSWNDAKAFCDWLSRTTGKPFRLPTEAEWEYACRAGSRTAYHWGDDPDAGKGWLNGADQTAKRTYASWPCFDFDDGYVYTAPVGSFKVNAFYLHDMHGNVWEWCNDRHGDKYYAESPRRNPQGPTSGSYRMSRGGSWDYYEHLYRSAVRVRLAPTTTYGGQGFRVACSRVPEF